MSVQEDTNAAEHPALRRRGAARQWAEPFAGDMKLVRRLGLTYVATEELTIRRQWHVRGFATTLRMARQCAARGSPDETSGMCCRPRSEAVQELCSVGITSSPAGGASR